MVETIKWLCCVFSPKTLNVGDCISFTSLANRGSFVLCCAGSFRGTGPRRAPTTARINVLGPEESEGTKRTHNSILPRLGSSTVVPKCSACAVSGYLTVLYLK